MSLPKTLPLRAANGKTIEIPTVGYGTYASGENSWAKDAAVTALREGYRHLDCAWFYGVDGAIGDAIRESGIPREEIFITSKFWPTFYDPENVELALDKVLKGMGLDYIDLWLAHWPVAWKPTSREGLEKAWVGPDATDDDKGNVKDDQGKPVIDWAHTSASLAKQNGKQGTFVPTFKAMQDLVRKGKARAIGVSNFTNSAVKELIPHEADVPISCNQVEVHPWLPQKELLKFHKSQQIVVTCYSPFAGQKEKNLALDENVIALAKKNGLEAGQMLQSWAVQRGTIPLGKSATPSRIKSNLNVRKLSDETMEALDAMEIPNGKGRTVDPTGVWGVQLFKED